MPYIVIKDDRLKPGEDGRQNATVSLAGVAVTGGAFPAVGAWTTLSASVSDAFFIDQYVAYADTGLDGYVEFGWGPAGDERSLGQFCVLRNNAGGAGTGLTSTCFLPIPTSLIPAGARLACRVSGGSAAGGYNVSVGGLRYDRAPRSLMVAHPNAYVHPLSVAAGSAGSSAYETIGTLLYPLSITHVSCEVLPGIIGNTNCTITLATGPTGNEAVEATIPFYGVSTTAALVSYGVLQPKGRVLPIGTLLRAKSNLTGALSRTACVMGLRGDLPVYSPF